MLPDKDKKQINKLTTPLALLKTSIDQLFTTLADLWKDHIKPSINIDSLIAKAQNAADAYKKEQEEYGKVATSILITAINEEKNKIFNDEGIDVKAIMAEYDTKQDEGQKKAFIKELFNKGILQEMLEAIKSLFDKKLAEKIDNKAYFTDYVKKQVKAPQGPGLQ